jgi:hypothetical protein
MINFVRLLFAPIFLRFQTTEGLQQTLNLLTWVDQSKLKPGLAKRVIIMEKYLAKELISRNVKIWER